MSTVSKVMDATIVTGEYTNAQGEQKKSYLKIGTLFLYQDGGMSLKLDAVPVGNGNINFYERKPKQGSQPQQPQGYATGGGVNNPSPVQQQAYNQQQNVPVQHLPQQNVNTQGNGYPPQPNVTETIPF